VLDDPEQIKIFPLIEPGVPGAELTVTDNVCTAEVPQLFVADTVIFPPPVPAVVFIILLEELPVQPPGSVQLYEVAPVIAATLYEFEEPEQIEMFPLIKPGVEGTDVTVTDNV
jgi:hypothetical protein